MLHAAEQKFGGAVTRRLTKIGAVTWHPKSVQVRFHFLGRWIVQTDRTLQGLIDHPLYDWVAVKINCCAVCVAIGDVIDNRLIA